MTTRVASPDDLFEVVHKTLTFAKGTRFWDLMDEDTVIQFVSRILNNPDGVVFLADDGILVGQKTPSPYGTFDIALENVWWVAPSKRNNGLGRELLEAFEAWAKEKNCQLISVSCMNEEVGQMYEKLGYKLQECTYLKEVK